MNDAEIKLQVMIDESTASKSIDTLSTKTDKLSKSFTKAGKTLTAGLTVPIVGLVAVGVKYNATVEDLTTSFKVMTGSADKAGDVVERLKDIGSKTPFEFADLAETTKLLMNYGLTADDAIDKMQMLGDISQGNADKMNRISMAYGQMSSAGKVSLEDVKQMIEAGFNPLKEISESTGESMSSLYNRISKGKISVDEITKSMERSTSKGGKYFNSMEEQSKTTSGQLSTLKDGFLSATGSLTESLIPAFKSGVAWLTKLTNWFSSLSEEQKLMILKIIGLLGALGPFLLILGQIIKAVKILGTVIGFLTSPIGLVIIAIGLIGFAIYQLIKNWDTVTKIISSGVNYWKSVFSSLASFVSSIFRGIVNGARAMANLMIGLLNGMIKGFLYPFNAIIKGLNKIPGIKLKLLSFAIPKIPALEVGTDFVAQDGLAYLHKGESVQPASVAGGGYSTGQYATIQISMGDINMDSNKVGRAVTPYITKVVKLGGGNI